MTTGLCECGCGRPTKLASVTDRRKGWIAGQPKRFIMGHSGHRWVSPGFTIDERSGCWNWNGYLRPRDKRAGSKRLPDGSHTSAYRYYYEQRYGPVPEGLVLDHTCRNPQCVNPEHLEPVSQLVNILRGVLARLGRDWRAA